MTSEKILPIILITIQALSSIPYALKGNWWMAFYWFFASALNFCVTFKN